MRSGSERESPSRFSPPLTTPKRKCSLHRNLMWAVFLFFFCSRGVMKTHKNTICTATCNFASERTFLHPLSKKCTPTTCIEMSTVMGAVSVARGSGNGSDSEAHRTVYISSIDSTRREYTLLHESCHAVRTVSLMRENLDRSSLKIYDVSAPQSDIFNPYSFEC